MRRRVESIVLALLALTIAACAGFILFYVARPDTQLLGLTIGLGLAFLAAAAIVAAKALLPKETAVEERPEHGDPEAVREVEQILDEGAGGVSRRRLLLGAAGAAGASLGAAALFPATSFGPRVGDRIYRTPWQRGRRVVDEQGVPITAEDVLPDGFLTGFPEGAGREELGSPLIVVRVDPASLELSPEGAAGAPEGILAFSKICTHAGCAVSLYQRPLHPPTAPPTALVCPCHYSTFDPARGGEVVFGPAGRPLPQLPLEIALDRTLTAAGDLLGHPGPSFGGSRLGDG